MVHSINLFVDFFIENNSHPSLKCVCLQVSSSIGINRIHKNFDKANEKCLGFNEYIKNLILKIPDEWYDNNWKVRLKKNTRKTINLNITNYFERKINYKT